MYCKNHMPPLSPAVATSTSPEPQSQITLDELEQAVKNGACLGNGAEGCVYALRSQFALKVTRHRPQDVELLVQRLETFDGYTAEEENGVVYLTPANPNTTLVIPTHLIVLNHQGKDWYVMSRGTPLLSAFEMPCAQEHAAMQQAVELVHTIFTRAPTHAPNMDIKFENMLYFENRVVLCDICCAAGTLSYMPWDGAGGTLKAEYTHTWVAAVVALEFYLKNSWWAATTITPEKTRGFLPDFPNITALLSVACKLGVVLEGFTPDPSLVVISQPPKLSSQYLRVLQHVFQALWTSLTEGR